MTASVDQRHHMHDKGRTRVRPATCESRPWARCNERIMPDGRKRNSVHFSIIDAEWPDVKVMLQRKLER